MTWRDELAALNRNLTLRPGCSPAWIAEAETRLGASLPRDLRAFLEETDGLYDNDAQYWYGWDLERIITENLYAWQDEDLLLDNSLLAFGSDGAGDWFCLALDEGRKDVLHWSWIDGEARSVAADLQSFWAGWLTGELTV